MMGNSFDDTIYLSQNLITFFTCSRSQGTHTRAHTRAHNTKTCCVCTAPVFVAAPPECERILFWLIGFFRSVSLRALLLGLISAHTFFKRMEGPTEPPEKIPFFVQKKIYLSKMLRTHFFKLDEEMTDGRPVESARSF